MPAGGRAECVDGERPCPYVRCRYHLWLVLSEDRAGRPWGGRRPPTTLLPAWLEHPTPACCALDVADAASSQSAPLARTAEALHLSPSRVWMIVVAALKKLKARGVELSG